ncbi:uncharacterized protein LOC126571087 isoform X2 [Anopheles aquasalis]|uniref:uncharacterized protein LOC126571087 isoform X2 n=1 Tax=Anopheles aquasalis TaxID=42839 RepID=UPI00215AF3CD|nr:uncharacterized protein LOC126571087 isoform X2 [Anopheles aquasalis]
MRKTWVKRDNIYYKPFYKQKLKLTLIGVLGLGVLFFVYQLVYIKLGADGSPPSPSSVANREYGSSKTGIGQHQYAYVERIGNHERMILRGIRLRDLDRYTEPTSMPRAPFRCLQTGRELSWDRVNDDYCDCQEDGSDEPSTSACANGRFYCRFQKRHRTGRGRDRSIPSGWVNDGVCDCCDGSDEWLPTGGNLVPLRPCPNTCSTKYFL